MTDQLDHLPEPSVQKRPVNRRSKILIVGVASVAALGVIVPSVVLATQEVQPVARATHADEVLDLENLELGQLADELDRLGLELHVVPADADISAEVDDLDSDFEQDLDDEFEQEGSLEDDQQGSAEGDDPFAGMTDEEIDALSDEEFFDLLDRAGIDADFDEQGDAGDEFDDGTGDEEGISFGVSDGELTTSEATPEQRAQAEKIWGRFTQIIPAGQIRMISAFELMSEEYGGAHVYADDSDPTKWILGVSLGIGGEELDSILVHEFGHLLTLNAREIPPSDEFGTCPTFNPGEGCALKGSTIDEFVQEFWPQSMRDEIDRINDTDDWDALDKFYEENSDSFVTDYAVTNPVEDLAETFTEFVLKDRPSGSTVADQKVQMLWGDPDLVSLREEILSRM
jgi:hypothetical protein